MVTLRIAPAEATRFTEPTRTSPAANTPGRLVSSGSGSMRPSPGEPPGKVSAGQDEPVPFAGYCAGQPVGVR